MKRMGMQEARHRFKELIDTANESGEPVVVTKHRRRVAVLLPGRLTIDLLRGLDAAPELIEMALAMARDNRVPDPEDVEFVKLVAKRAVNL